MKIIIPMAGFGTRLRPHTHSRPKPLVNVAGRPLLDHVIESLAGVKIDEYIFIVGYLGDQIEEYVRTNYDIDAHFVVQEEMKGQSHAIYLAKEYMGGPAIVLFSDTIFASDLRAINESEKDGVIYTMEVEDPRSFGVVSLDDEGVINDFIEKPDSMENRNAVIGLYYVKDSDWLMRAIEAQINDEQLTKGEYYIADAFKRMIDEGAQFTTSEVDFWLDCGKPPELLQTNAFLLENGAAGHEGAELEGATLIEPVFVHPSAKVTNSVIGPNVTVSEGAVVSESIIRNSVIDVHATVSGAILNESLVGRHATVTGSHHKLNVGAHASVNIG